MKPTTIALICLGAAALGVFLGHATKTCKPCEFTQADLDSIAIVNHHLTEQYLADSANTEKLKQELADLKASRNTDIPSRVNNATKALHSTGLDTLHDHFLRPIRPKMEAAE